MRGIILAAGRGSRLAPHTDSFPKPMVTVGGTPILTRTISLLEAHATDGIVVVGGYQAERLDRRGHALVLNTEWASTNILASLFAAEAWIEGHVLVSYGDTMLSDAIVAAAAAQPEHDITVIADTAWTSAYIGRQRHPPAEAEKVVLRGAAIAKIGKSNISVGEADAEFVGLLRLTPAGSAKLKRAYRNASLKFSDKPFVTANTLRHAYLTDLLQYMIDGGELIAAKLVSGGWREIDTSEDLSRAEKWLDAGC